MDTRANEPPRIQVIRYRPGAWFWWLLPVLLAAVFVIGYGLGNLANATADPAGRLAILSEGFDAQRMEELQSELAELKMTQMVDGGAAREVQASFRELQDEIAAREEEVAFYRSLMAPEELAKGLHIEKMLLHPTERPNLFAYELVIAQTVARHSWQEGELYFEVHGSLAGDGEGESEGENVGRQVLALTEIATLPAYPLLFRFRYFQNYTGEMTLPAGFVPETVIITLDRGGATDVVQRRYEWFVQ